MNGKSINQRAALLIAGGMTAFTLVGLGALAGQLSNTTAQPAATPAVVIATDAVAPAIHTAEQPVSLPAGSNADSAFSAREAQYQALIQEANRRIEEANRRLAEMEQQLSRGQAAPAETVNVMAQTPAQAGPAQAPNNSVPAVALLPQRALEIAQTSAPGAVAQRLPELVNFQGTVAYEVAFNTGMVYVDANSGALLYNGAAAQPLLQSRYDDDDEHDDDDDDDDHDEHERREHKEKDHDD